jgi:hypothetical protein
MKKKRSWQKKNMMDEMIKLYKRIFFSPITSSLQWGIILLVAILFIFLPQSPPIDWDLNVKDLWVDGLNIYDNPNRVYPPWGLILLIPYYLLRAEGSRIASVLVIAWMSHSRGWNLSRFMAMVLCPYFQVTLAKSNIDILVFVFPVLLWEHVEKTRWQSVGRGLALSILLLKPQGAVLLWLYLVWKSRKEWQKLTVPFLIVAINVIPISLLGSPPLIIQWLDNINNPSPSNTYYWSNNNISLTRYFSIYQAAIVLSVLAILLLLLMRWRETDWSKEHTLSSLLQVSMFLSPYTSQQSYSSALAFVPSLGSFLVQNIVLLVTFIFSIYLENIPVWVLLNGIAALFLYRSGSRKLSRRIELKALKFQPINPTNKFMIKVVLYGMCMDARNRAYSRRGARLKQALAPYHQVWPKNRDLGPG